MANPQVIVDFIANTSGLNKGLREASTGSQGLGSRFRRMGKAAAIAGGAAGLAALTGTLKVGIDELTNAAKVSAQTRAAIKSTGGAAHLTATQVSDLATALMTKTGIDDEAIQSGENLLLTFTKIQNQAGKGNDIFTQATKIMLDMSVALGQDTKSSAIQLGKALQDPVKGITALRRVGVSFTDAQKEQIKTLVASGRTMDAQKLILRELNREFGGSAVAAGKTLPGQLNILKESFNNLAGVLVSTLAPALAAVTKFLVENPALAKALVIGVLALAAAMVTLNVAMAVTAALSSEVTIPLIAIGAAVAGLVAVVVLLVKNWDTMTSGLADGFAAIKSAGLTVFNWIKDNWPLLLGIIGGPFGLAAAEIATHWDTIKQGVSDAWNAIKDTISGVITGIKDLITGLSDWITRTATAALKTAIGKIGGLFSAIGEAAWHAIRAVKNAINDIAEWLVKTATAGVRAAVNAVRSTFSALGAGAWAAIQSVKNAIGNVGEWLTKTATSFIRGAVTAVGSVFHVIGDAAWSAIRSVKSAISDVLGWLWGVVDKVGNVASTIANAIKSPINAVIRAWNGLRIPGFHIHIGMPGPIPDINFGWGGIGLPNIPLLASGGVVERPTLAMIGEAGREIVTPEALLREIIGEQSRDIHVYIGDRELTDLVRVQITDASNGLARTLLAGTTY